MEEYRTMLVNLEKLKQQTERLSSNHAKLLVQNESTVDFTVSLQHIIHNLSENNKANQLQQQKQQQAVDTAGNTTTTTTSQ